MVFHVEPVADILAFAIDRERFAMADIVDEERNELFGELVRTVVVRAVRYDGRHSVGVVEGTDEVVAAGFRGRIRTVRSVLRFFREEGAVELQGAIDFVGRYMVEAFAFVAFREAFPINLGGLQETQRAHHICPCKSEGVFNGAVHVAFGSKVDDAGYFVLLHQFQHLVEVADVCLDEGVVRFVLDILQVRQVSGIRQFIYIYYMVFRIFRYKKADYMTSDKAGTAGDDDMLLFHYFTFSKLIIHCFKLSFQ